MRTLITGVLGQDGSYLAEQLRAEGHTVFGMSRRPCGGMLLGDLLDQDSLKRVLIASQPDVVFNLAAVTSPGGAWGTPQPPLLADVTGVGVVRLLDAMCKTAPGAKLVHASSSAIYDPGRYGLYGIAKQFAHEAVCGYRDRLWASNAVLFSHTSPRQDHRFLARRITSTLARIAHGSDERLVLGDVESRRDWGFAPDYTRAMHLIAKQSHPGDFVIATGRSRSVREFTDAALSALGLGWDAVRISRSDPIPDELHPESRDAQLQATRALGWKPETGFTDMIGLMCQSPS